MLKRYTFEQLEEFVSAFRMSSECEVSIGTSNFTTSIYNALCEIYDIVSSGIDLSAQWDKSNPKYHSWLSFDAVGQELLYDTGVRNEEWSNTLIEGIFARFDLEEIYVFEEKKKTKEFKDLFTVIKDYYDTQGYFNRILSKGSGGISYSEWERVSTNKYAMKVLHAYMAEPRFDVGQLVSLRTARECTKKRIVLRNCPSNIICTVPSVIDKVLILSNSEPIRSARKGAKRYKVAPIGGNGQPFWIEEAFMKKLRKKVNKKEKPIV